MLVQVFNEILDKTLLDLFNELGIQITLNKGDFGFVYRKDLNALRIAKTYDNFYSYDTVRKLIRKDLLSELLGDSGFDILPSKIINDESDFDHTRPIIIKPLVGQGGVRLGSKIQDSSFIYKIFYKNIPREVLQYPGKYFWQEAITEPSFFSYVISGAVNGNSEVWFIRDTKIEKTNIIEYKTRTRRYNYPELAYLQDKLRKFILHQNIKNAAFSVQFLKHQEKFYVHDWNFRISKRHLFDMRRTNQTEMLKYFKHMFDIPNSHPDFYPDEWIIDDPESYIIAPDKWEYNMKQYYGSHLIIRKINE
jgi:hypothetical protein